MKLLLMWLLSVALGAFVIIGLFVIGALMENWWFIGSSIPVGGVATFFFHKWWVKDLALAAVNKNKAMINNQGHFEVNGTLTQTSEKTTIKGN